MNHIKAMFFVFWQLCVRDFHLALSEYKNRALNLLIWSNITLFVFTYLMPQSGLEIGSLILVANCATSGLFDTTENLAAILSDLEGERSITYYLTLPIPQWLVFVQIALNNALRGLSIAILLFPAGLLLFWGQFTLPAFSLIQFISMLLISNLFYGFFSLITASYTKNVLSMNNLWVRVIFPMWYIGCYQFTWQQMYTWNSTLAYINLLNPITYIMEGFRAATINSADSLNIWLCLFVLLIFTIIMGYLGTKKFMKRLDCIS